MDIEIRCACGKVLKEGDIEKDGRWNAYIEVEPCPDCMSEKFTEGVEEGESNG